MQALARTISLSGARREAKHITPPLVRRSRVLTAPRQVKGNAGFEIASFFSVCLRLKSAGRADFGPETWMPRTFSGRLRAPVATAFVQQR